MSGGQKPELGLPGLNQSVGRAEILLEDMWENSFSSFPASRVCEPSLALDPLTGLKTSSGRLSLSHFISRTLSP